MTVFLPSPEPIYEDPDYPYYSSVLDKTNTTSARIEIPLQKKPKNSQQHQGNVVSGQELECVTSPIEQQENEAYGVLANQQQSSGDQTEEQC